MLKYYDFYEFCHFVECFCIEEHTNCIIMHHTICSGFLEVYQIAFIDYKIAKDKEDSWTTKLFTHIFLEENKNNILDGMLALWKMIGVVQKKVVVGGCAVVSVINCLRLLIFSTEYPGLNYQDLNPCSIFYTLKLGKCVYCFWLIMYIVLMTDAWINWNKQCDITTFVNAAATIPTENILYLHLTYPIYSFLWLF